MNLTSFKSRRLSRSQGSRPGFILLEGVASKRQGEARKSLWKDPAFCPEARRGGGIFDWLAMASCCTTRTGSGGMFSRPSMVGTLALSLAVMSEAGGAGAGFARGASALRSSTSNADGARSRPSAGPAFVPQLLNFALRKTNGVMQRATCTKQGMADRKKAIQIVDGDDGAEVETNPSSGAQLVTYGAFKPVSVGCN